MSKQIAEIQDDMIDLKAGKTIGGGDAAVTTAAGRSRGGPRAQPDGRRSGPTRVNIKAE